jgi:hypothetical protein
MERQQLYMVSILILLNIITNKRVVYPNAWEKKAKTNFGIGRGNGGRNRRYKISQKRNVCEFFSQNNKYKSVIHLTESEFLTIVYELKEYWPKIDLKTPNTRLGFKNQVLLLFIWIVNYPHLHTLAALFGISSTVTSQIISHILPYLTKYFLKYIPEQRVSEKSSSIHPDIKYIIDSTITMIRKPTISQKKFYNGHYHCHGIITHVLIDFEGWILSVCTGIPGSVHDARVAQEIEPFKHIVNDSELVLGDPGYNGVDYIIAGYKPSELPDTAEAVEFDFVSRQEQRMIEHVNSHFKKCVIAKGLKFRHGRDKLTMVVLIAAGLYNWKKHHRNR